MQGEHLEQFLTPEEVAGRLVVPRKTVLDWLRTGALKGVKAGRLGRIREPDVLAFLREPERPEETRP